MLMMMRSDDNYSPSETRGCSAEQILKCLVADDYAACIAECATTTDEPTDTTGNGLITVSKVGSTSTVETPAVAINVKVGSIKLTAGEYDTKVSAVELTKSGLGAFDTDDLQVALRNGNIETDYYSVSRTTDKVRVKFSPALVVKAGKSETFDVIVNTYAGLENATYSFAVTDVIVANGKANGTPISLGTIKTTSAEPKTVDISIDDGLNNLKAGDTEKLIAKINVNFDKSAGKLNRISLLNVTANDTDKLGEAFTNVNAYVDGKKIGNVNIQDEKIVISDLNINGALEDEVSIEVKADVIYNKVEAYFLFRLDSIDITQEGYDFGLVPFTWTLPDVIEQTNDVYVKGNNITFKKVALETKEYVPGAKNIVMYDATFKSAIDARITDVTIEGTTELTAAILSTESAKITINGDPVELNDVDVTTDPLNIAIHGLKINVDANKDVPVKVILSTRKPVTGAHLVDMESQYKVKLEGRSIENVNNTFETTLVAGDKVTVKEGTAKFVVATATAPATRSLFPNKEQEVGRFAITADGDNLTLNEFTLSYDTSLDAEDMESLFDGNFTLVDVESNDVIAADFDLDTTNEELVISNIKNYEIAKDATSNLKLMVNLGSLDTFYGETVKFSVKANSVDAKTSVRTLDVNDSVDLSTVDYTMRMVAPEIELTKISETKFQVVIKNTDRDTAIDVQNLRYRVVTTVADNDFVGSVCLTDDSSLIECPAGHDFGARGTELTTIETIQAKGSKTYYIVVDGTSIEPAVLQASISSLSYAETTKTPVAENYSITVK